MDIESKINALSNVFSAHEAARDTLLADTSRTEEWRKQQLNLIEANHAGQAETALKQLWGDLEPQADGSYSQSGEVWAELERLQQEITSAQDSAVNLASGEQAARLQAVLGSLQHDPDAFMVYYRTKATSAERQAAQDFLAGLIPQGQRIGTNGMLWNRAIKQLETDRAERMNTPAVQRAREQYNALIAAMDTAYALTRHASLRYGLQSGAIAAYAESITRQVGDVPTYTRRAVRGGIETDEQRRARLYGYGKTPLGIETDEARRARLYGRDAVVSPLFGG